MLSAWWGAVELWVGPGAVSKAEERSPVQRRATRRALNLLSLEVAAAFYLVVISFLGPSGMLRLIEQNDATPAFRRWLLLAPLTAALAARVGGAWLAARSPLTEARLVRLVPLLGLVLVSWPLPALLVTGTFARSELVLMSLVGALALGLERTMARAGDALGALLRRFHAATQRLPAAVPWLTVALVLGSAWTFACFGSLRVHDKMLTSGFDLGIFENVFFNTLHGRPGVGLGRAYFAEHAELFLYVLLPLYALVPRAETLLVVQATLVVGAGLPLYLLARRWLSSHSQALALLVVYLSLPAVHGPLFYDFHFLPLSAFFLLWAAYFFARRATVAFWVAILGAMSCREDVALGLCLVGLGLLLFERSRRTALPLAALGAVWFGFIKFVWMRRYGAEAFVVYYDALIPRGASGFGAVLRTVISNPLYTLQKTATEDKLLLALHLFAPLAFLPIRQARTLPLLLPGVAVIGLATNRSAISQVHFHYAMHFVPYAMIATVAALASRPRAARGPLVFAMLVATAVASAHFGAFFGERFRTSFHTVSFEWSKQDDLRRDAFLKLAARIPSDATVAAGEHEAAHLARRPRLLALKEGIGDARFVIYSVRSLRWGGRGVVKKALTSGRYGVVAIARDLALLERGANTAKNEHGLRHLGTK